MLMSDQQKMKKKKTWDEIYEDKHIKNKIVKHKSSSCSDKYLIESRLNLMIDLIKTTKFNTDEFNALLDECVDLYIELHEDILNNSHKNDIVKYVKDNILQNEIIGEFDGKKMKQDIDWPFMGRVYLKDAIEKNKIGQNSKVELSNNLKYSFNGNGKINNQPSPSSEITL